MVYCVSFPTSQYHMSADSNMAAVDVATVGSKDVEVVDVDEDDNGVEPEQQKGGAASTTDEKKRLANKRKKEKAKQRKQQQKQQTLHTEAAGDGEMLQLSASFPSLSMHRYFQPPLVLAFNARQGRHLLLSSPLPAHSLLFSQLPYACVVTDSHASVVPVPPLPVVRVACYAEVQRVPVRSLLLVNVQASAREAPHGRVRPACSAETNAG